MSTVWEDICQQDTWGLQRAALSPYGNLTGLLQDPRSTDPKFKEACKNINSAVSGNFKIAGFLDDALADPKSRTAVFNAAKNNPDMLNAAIQKISIHPENSTTIIADLQKTADVPTQAAKPEAPAIAATAPVATAPREEQNADGTMQKVDPNAPSTAAPGADRRPQVAANNPATGNTQATGQPNPDDATTAQAGRPQAAAPAAEEGGFLGMLKNIGKIIGEVIGMLVQGFMSLIKGIGNFLGGLFGGHSSGHTSPMASQQLPALPGQTHAQVPGLSKNQTPSADQPFIPPAYHEVFPNGGGSQSVIPAEVKLQANTASNNLREAGVTPTAEGRSNTISGVKPIPAGEALSV